VFEDGLFAKDHSFMFLGGTDGSAPVQLGEGIPAALSPDGRRALGFPSKTLADSQRTLAVVPTGAGESRILPRGTIDRYLDAFWFPDGQRVLIVAHEKDRPARLFQQNIEQGAPRPVTPEGAATDHPTLAPDASGVLAGSFEAGAVFRFYPLTGGEPRSVPGLLPGDAPLRFDATGRFIFVRERSRNPEENRAIVLRVDTRTGQREPWLELQPSDRAGLVTIPMLRLSADGRSYVYTFGRDQSNLFLVQGLR
jgi:hypothetical protein